MWRMRPTNVANCSTKISSIHKKNNVEKKVEWSDNKYIRNRNDIYDKYTLSTRLNVLKNRAVYSKIFSLLYIQNFQYSAQPQGVKTSEQQSVRRESC